VIGVRWHHRQRPGDEPIGQELTPGAEALCEETGEYLRGHSAELFATRRLPIPAWAFLNAPTHRSAAEVLNLAEQVPSARLGPRWDAVPTAVAAALVVLSYGTASTVAQLQLERLFPLEQALITGDVHVRTPGELVHLAVVALRTGRWPCHT